jgi:hypothetical protein
MIRGADDGNVAGLGSQLMWGKSAGLTVAVASVLLVSSCGSSTETVRSTSSSITATTTTPTVTLQDWAVDDVTPAMNKMGDALNWVAGAIDSRDLSDARAAARSMNSAIDELEATLPSPSTTADQYVESAVDHFREFARGLMGIGPSTTRDEMDEMMQHQKEGMADMQKVKHLVRKQG